MAIKDLFQEFKETKAKFDERYNSNKNRIQELNAELRELKAKYNDRVYQEEIGGEVFTAKDMAQFKSRMREIADEIEELETRNDFNRRGRIQKLVELIPAMKARVEARRAELEQEHAAQMEQVKHNLAVYLMSLKEMGDIERKISQANAEFIELAKEAGTNERLPNVEKVKLYEWDYGGSIGGVYIPGRPKAGIYGVLREEVENAYEGKLPSWTHEYLK